MNKILCCIYQWSSSRGDQSKIKTKIYIVSIYGKGNLEPNILKPYFSNVGIMIETRKFLVNMKDFGLFAIFFTDSLIKPASEK